MTSGETSGGWYVRVRGRVRGPLTWAQRHSLRDRGQLARFHEVSQDRQTWVGADSLAGLFPRAEAGRLPGSTTASAHQEEYVVLDDAGADPSGSTIPVAHEAASWFFV